MKRQLLIITAALLAWLPAMAQQVVWSADLNSTIQNREGGDEMRPDQTFIYTRLGGEVGLQFADSDGSTHTLMGGASWLQPINDQLSGYKVTPTVYYRYCRQMDNATTLASAIGWVPRSQLLRELPAFAWSDSMAMEHSHIRGAVLTYSNAHRGHVQALLDWRQMQSENRREAFNAAVSGRWSPRHNGKLWMGGMLQYNHLAKRKNAPDDEGVNDDVLINPMLGIDASAGQVALSAEAGMVASLQRARADNRWRNQLGAVATVSASWRWLTVSEHVFAGGDLMPLYPRFGSELNLGDPWYRDDFYSRTTVTATLVRNAVVDLTASLAFHASDNTTGFWQQVSCRVHFDSAQRKTKQIKQLTPITAPQHPAQREKRDNDEFSLQHWYQSLSPGRETRRGAQPQGQGHAAGASPHHSHPAPAARPQPQLRVGARLVAGRI